MTLPPVMRREAKSSIGKAGRKSEVRLAKELGARLTPASGAMQGAKGDFQTARWLFEAKSTLTASLSLKLDWLAKITGEARTKNRRPALTVSFITADGRPHPSGEWVMIPRKDFEELTACQSSTS